jgi:hypothetical protein
MARHVRSPASTVSKANSTTPPRCNQALAVFERFIAILSATDSLFSLGPTNGTPVYPGGLSLGTHTARDEFVFSRVGSPGPLSTQAVPGAPPGGVQLSEQPVNLNFLIVLPPRVSACCGSVALKHVAT